MTSAGLVAVSTDAVVVQRNPTDQLESEETPETSNPTKSEINSKIKLLGIGFFLIFIIAFIVFMVFYFRTANATSVNYSYSCPLSMTWMGIGSFWLCIVELFWFFYFQDSTLTGHVCWLAVNVIFSLSGFICLVSFASSRAEGDAAAGALLWIGTGLCGVACSLLSHPHSRSLPNTASEAEERASCGRTCLRCLGSCRAWLLGLVVAVQAFFLALTFGVTIQAAAAASDYARFPPIGAVHTVKVRAPRPPHAKQSSSFPDG